jgi:4'-phosphopantetheinyl transferase EntD
MLTDVLADLLPAQVATVIAADGIDPPPLLPEEQPYVAHAVDKRTRELALGRHCSRLALRRLGVAEPPIPVGRNREPLWPAGIVGSITHCEGFCAAAVARRVDVAGLGIDAEVAVPLADDLIAYVCTLHERAQWRGLMPLWSTLLFSAKESIYKCTFPLTGRFLEFQDVEISLQPGGSFSASSSVVDLGRIVGRYSFTDRHVLTSAITRPA